MDPPAGRVRPGVRRGLRLDADHDAGRPDLGVLFVQDQGWTFWQSCGGARDAARGDLAVPPAVQAPPGL